MPAGPVPPTIPPAETGTPSEEWSESLLAANTAKDSPAGPLKIPREEDKPDMSEKQSRRESRAPKELEDQAAQSGQGSEPAATGVVAEDYRQQGSTGTGAWSSLFGKPEEEQHVSLPSTELEGAQPAEHTGGVGALPGNLSESSVALLPDERQERAQEGRPTSPRQRRDTIKPSTAIGGDDECRQSVRGEEAEIPGDVAPSKDEPVASQKSDVPPQSTEAEGAETAESSVAASTGPKVESQKEVSEAKKQEASGAQEETAGAVPGTEEPSEQKKDVQDIHPASEEVGQEQGPSQEVQGEGKQEEQTAPAKKVLGGYSGDYHPAQLHPLPPGASVADYQSTLGTQQQEQPPSPTAKTGKRASIGGEKKPGFMTMVKGEMKIIAGKMSGDEQKVEAGKKLVHGEM